MDIELATRCGDGNLIKNRNFQKHFIGGITHARPLTTHDAGKIIRAIRIANDQHIFVKIIGFFI